MCIKRKWKVNENKSKVMNYTKGFDGRRMNVVLNAELLEEVKCFKHRVIDYCK